MMKRVTLALAAAVMAGCVTSSVDKVEQRTVLKPRDPKPLDGRKRVAVADFEDKSEYGRGRVGMAAADILTNELVESQQFAVYERKQLAKALDEQKLGQSGIIDPSTAAQVGKVIGVDYILYGVVSNVGIAPESTNVILYQRKRLKAHCTVLVRMIDVKTSMILFSKQGDGLYIKDATGSLGLGGSMGYDETMMGEALAAAIRKNLDEMLDTAERMGH
jgi:curli biogenesis system outer membrane secretion channel CsgG